MSNGERLQGALKLLGYENSKEPFDRSNLVLAIQFFAGVQQDDALETESRLKLKKFEPKLPKTDGSRLDIVELGIIHAQAD